MAELRDVGRMLEAAEHAAAADDLAAADELLRSIARIQEAELGPLHPDLANTLNNLAVVAENAGRLGDAETFYRRAVAIASASLPADHPMVAASRNNLEDFCRARGLAIDTSAVAVPAAEHSAVSAPAGGEVVAAASPPDIDATPAPPESPRPGPAPPARTPPEPQPPSPRREPRTLAKAAIGVVVVLVIAMILVRRPWSSRETPTAAPAAGSTTPARPPAPALPTPVPTVSAPTEQPRPPTIVPPSGDRSVAAGKSPAASRSSGAGTVVTAQLCRTFSTSGGSWRCDPADDPVSPGALVLYTRIKSPRDAVVVHRWYRGETLRQSVRLTIRANATDGYRTYSRQTVDRGDWHVEVRNAEGALLQERRFVVQ
jgi:Protein of unknown function (DUF2914)/Tetratricopeptide repeat